MINTLESGASWQETIADKDNQVRYRETMGQKENSFEQIGG
jgi:hypothetical protein